MVSIRSMEDLREVFSDILKSEGNSCKVILWCDGLKEEIVLLARRNVHMIWRMIVDQRSIIADQRRKRKVNQEKIEKKTFRIL